MKVENFKVTKLMDSLYGNVLQNIDDEAIYCEIQLQRDRSSFAGIALNITKEKNGVVVKECQERVIEKISEYEKLYIGCEQDYIDSIKEIYSLEEREYGIHVLFLVYSDVRSSQIIFEELMKKVDKNIEKITEML